MPQFNLVVQHPEPREHGPGCLSIGRNGDAEFFEGDAASNARVLASMVRTRIEWSAAAGIMLSGMESTGYDEAGKPTYRHQEWLLRHLQPRT